MFVCTATGGNHCPVVSVPPTRTEVRVDSASPSQAVTVSENDDVSFVCTATGGNPAATLTLSDPGSGDQTGPSPLTHDVTSVQCEASGVYTCTANNGFGQDVTATTTLYVNCEFSLDIVGDGVAQLVDPKDRGSNPFTSTRKHL